jgi:glycosyltransferase involved in cell wall biosynthesis
MISVLILTYNESIDLPGCLGSVNACDDVHVFDSFSKDDTEGIAKAHGAHILQRAFTGYSSQRNAALSECAFLHDWILILDADERIPAGVWQALLNLVRKADASVGAFRLRRRDFMDGRWLKHAQLSPFYIRLVRKGRASYHREINEVIRIDGRVVDTVICFDHFPFSKGIGHWLQKHDRYSDMEARRMVDERRARLPFSFSKALFSKDFNLRRYHQKGLFYRMPFRPVLKWLYMVCIRFAFLDGIQGIRYANLQAWYEYTIVLKAREILNNASAAK